MQRMSRVICLKTSVFIVCFSRTHFNLSLRTQRGNLVAIATAVRRCVCSLIEIATSLCSSQ